jgi:nickel/cobalt transporter (NiCoT) family protein
VVALVIGTVELIGLLGRELGAEGSFWRWVSNVNINELGFIIVGLFVVTWAIALSVWHFAHIEDRWSPREADGAS